MINTKLNQINYSPNLVAPVEGQDMSRPALNRSQSRAFLSEDGMPQPIEYFLASDASAIVEHTKRVLYLEDDDIAHIADGGKLSPPPPWYASCLWCM